LFSSSSWRLSRSTSGPSGITLSFAATFPISGTHEATPRAFVQGALLAAGGVAVDQIPTLRTGELRGIGAGDVDTTGDTRVRMCRFRVTLAHTHRCRAVN